MAANTTRRGSRHFILVLAVMATVVAVDQAVKWWVVRNLVIGEPKVIIPHQLVINRVANSGAAFSFGTGVTWIFTVFASAMIVAIIIGATRVEHSHWAACLGLIGGGAAGNLLDRLFRAPGFGVGHVIDFIQIPWFAIFNIADIAISFGVVMFVLLVLLGKPFRTTVKQAD